jgi:hypothetical protein
MSMFNCDIKPCCLKYVHICTIRYNFVSNCSKENGFYGIRDLNENELLKEMRFGRKSVML